MNKILFYVPIKKPVTGQSLVSENAYNIYIGEKEIVNTNFEGKGILVKILLTLFSLMKLIKKIVWFKPDSLYLTPSRSLFGFFKDFISINLASIFGCKCVCHIHGSDFFEFKNKLNYINSLLFDLTYLKVDTFIVLNKKMVNDFSCFNANVTVIPNFYNDNYLVDCANKHDNKILKVVYLSNIVFSKGIFDLIDAVSVANKNSVICELYVAGDFVGDEYMSSMDIKNKFFESIKNKNITYLGFLNENEKYKLLSDADIFSLPSYYKSEAVPLSIIEAMYMECAVIVTNYKYLPSIIDGKCGFTVDVKDFSHIAKLLSCLYEDRKLLKSMQTYAKKHATSEYSYNRFASRINNVLTGIQNEK
ncbi:TPA: glycosyltransferase [Photobacterium damselae]